MVRIKWSKVVSGLAAVALAGAVGAFAWNVFGMSLDIGLARRISAARAAWDNHHVTNYRAFVRVIDYNRPALGDITVVVKDGKLVEASTTPAQSGNLAGNPLPADEGPNYTINGLFDYASTQVADLPDIYFAAQNGYHYSLTINPELNYIEEFKVDVCGRGPLAASLGECRWGFDVLDVRLGGE
jgi:hypothetical protein